MVYTFDVTSPPYDWYLQIDYEKVFQNLGKTRDTDLFMFTSVSFHYWPRHCQPLLPNIIAFQRLLMDASAALLIEKLRELPNFSEKIIYQVMSFFQKYISRGKAHEELVETRMR